MIRDEKELQENLRVEGKTKLTSKQTSKHPVLPSEDEDLDENREKEEEGLKNISYFQFNLQRNPLSLIPLQKIDQEELAERTVAKGRVYRCLTICNRIGERGVEVFRERQVTTATNGTLALTTALL
jgi:hypothetical protein